MKTLLFRPLQYLSAPRSSRYGLALAALIFLGLPPAPLRAVTVDGSQTFQVIDGFGANLRYWATNEVAPVLDALVDQAGMTLFRIIRDRADWETTNANSDPSVTNWVMNWAYYNGVYSAPEFETEWGMIAYLNQKGITNGISLNFMGMGPSWLIAPDASGYDFLIPGYEPQWAEMLTSLMLYARNARHLQFNLVEPNNEPDQGVNINKIRVTQSQQVTALEDLAQCLDANGLSDIRFVSPDWGFTSTSCMSALMNSPIIMPKLAHMGIHCYNDNFGGPSTGVYSFLQQSGHPDLNFWLTEFNEWCQSCEGGGSGNNSWSFAQESAYWLIYHLANGAAGAMVFTGCDTWMAYLNSNMGAWSYWGLFAVDDINATPKTFTARKGFYTLSQISKYVRPGARRIGLTGSTSPFNLLAFYHPISGQLTLTGVNPSGASPLSGTLASLPTFASFDLYYTSSTANLASGGTVPISSGAFSATIPADCVFTLVARPGLSVLLTNPPDGATYSSPATLSLQAAASAGTVTGMAFFAGNTALGQTTVAPYSLTWSNVPPGAYTLTAWVTNSLGNTAVSPAVHVTVIGPPAQVLVSPPYALVPPNGTQQFNATVTDALGDSIVPSPSVAWSVSGGASIATNGLLTAGGTPGGPFSVLAHSAGLTGSAVLNIATNGTPFLPIQPDRLVPELGLLAVTNSAIAGPFVTQSVTTSFSFAYAGRDALLADGWSFYATNNGSPRNTEFTNPASSAILYNAAGPLTIPCDVGDLWGTGNVNNTRNTLFRYLPTNWFSLQLALTFVPTAIYQQAHLVLYQDDDNYLEVGESYHPGQVLTMSQETGGTPTTQNTVTNSPANAWFRLDRNPLNNTVTGFYSLDGAIWNTFATVSLPLVNPRLAIWTGGSFSAYTPGMPVMVVRGLSIASSNAVPRTLAYSLLSPPSGAAIDTNGVITWQPTEAQGPGTNVLTTVAVDNSTPPINLTNSFTVIVQEVNTPPSLPFQAGRTLVGQQTLIVTNTATDTDIPPNPLSYQLATAPAGTAIDANGVITWTPAPNQVPGTNLLTTVVTDSNPSAINDQHLSATNSFTVMVAPLPQFHILSVAASNNAVWIAWESTPGRTYRLQYKNNLAETNWQEILPDILAAGPATSATNTLGSGASRLYRVRLLP